MNSSHRLCEVSGGAIHPTGADASSPTAPDGSSADVQYDVESWVDVVDCFDVLLCGCIWQ